LRKIHVYLSRNQQYIIINNAEYYVDTALKQDEQDTLYRPFEKSGMTNNKQHEDVVLDIAIYSSLLYLAEVERINNIKDATVAYKKELQQIAKLQAIKNLTNRFVKHIYIKLYIYLYDIYIVVL